MVHGVAGLVATGVVLGGLGAFSGCGESYGFGLQLIIFRFEGSFFGGGASFSISGSTSVLGVER